MPKPETSLPHPACLLRSLAAAGAHGAVQLAARGAPEHKVLAGGGCRKAGQTHQLWLGSSGGRHGTGTRRCSGFLLRCFCARVCMPRASQEAAWRAGTSLRQTRLSPPSAPQRHTAF